MKNILLLSFSIALLVSAGCKSVMESRFQTPSVTYPTQWQEAIPTGAPVPFQWQDFHDSELEQWLQQVLASNNDLALAALRLYRAQLEVERIGIETAPTVSGSLNVGTSKVVQGTPSPWTHHNFASLQVSYEVDLWGKLARQRDAVEWARQATTQDLAAARLSLLADASKNYWQIAYLNQRITFSQESIAYAQETLRLVQARYRAGSVAVLDVMEAEQNLANQENSHLELLRQLKQALNAQAVLLGSASGYSVQPQHLPEGPLPQISADIPAHVLARRPDINALELRLREALANVDVKRAQYYPEFNLTGGLGGSSDALLQLIGKPIAALGAQLALPFLQWRQREVEVKIARNDYEQRVLEFKQALYQAMAGVNDALSLRAQLMEQEKQLQQILARAYEVERFNAIRYREGATPINFWLDAQERRRLAQVAIDTNRYEQLQNLAQIYLEFGGESSWLP